MSTINVASTTHASRHNVGGADAISPVEGVNAVTTGGSAQTIPDVATKTINTITLTAACTLTAPTAAAGKSFVLELKQDGTGSRTVTWFSSITWLAGSAPTLTTTASKHDLFSFICIDGTNWLGIVIAQAY